MKYVSRGVLDHRGALGGVIKEVELLSSLEHPFLVNLWFSFQGKSSFLFRRKDFQYTFFPYFMSETGNIYHIFIYEHITSDGAHYLKL